MGSGGASAKIKALIEKEGERQLPSEKRLLKARYILAREEIKEKNKGIYLIKTKMITVGFTEEEIRTIEDEEDAEN